MKPSANRLIIYFVLALIFVALGLLREHTFLNLNYFIKKLSNTNFLFELPNYLAFAKHYSIKELIQLKWILTVLFTFLFYALTTFSIHIIFKNKYYTNLTSYIHLGLIAVAIIIFSLGFIFPSNEFYKLSRLVIGILHSPIIGLMMIAAFKILKSEQNH